MNNRPKVQNNTTIGSGKWLKLEDLEYSDSSGMSRRWENVTRHQCSGAVAIIATIKPSNQLILIRQYRPPADTYVIEFPAGLIDIGETAESTAVRELYEETGYTGEITRMTPPVFNSPGLTSETVNIAIMNVDETQECNQNPTPCLEDGEEIEALLVPLNELEQFIANASNAGDAIDAKVMSYALKV